MIIPEFETNTVLSRDRITPFRACLLHNTRIRLGDLNEVPFITDAAKPLRTTHKGQLLRDFATSYKFSKNGGRRFYYPAEDARSLEDAASAAGSEMISVKRQLLYFGVHPETLLMHNYGLICPDPDSYPTKRIATISCLFKRDAKGAVPEKDASVMLMKIDLLPPLESLRSTVVSAADNAVSAVPDMSGMGLAFAARQYNYWCDLLHGVKPIKVVVYPESRTVEVTRVNEARPLIHWTMMTWGRYRPRTGRYIAEVTKRTGCAILSLPQRSTLRTTIYTQQRRPKDYKSNKEQGGKHLLAAETDSAWALITTARPVQYLLKDEVGAVKVKAGLTPPQDATHKFQFVEVSLAKVAQ